MKTMEKRIRNLENYIRPSHVDWSNMSDEEKEKIVKAAGILNTAERQGRLDPKGNRRGEDDMVAVTGTDEEHRTLEEAIAIVVKRTIKRC